MRKKEIRKRVNSFNIFIAEHKIPMFIDNNLELTFNYKMGNCKYKVVIISVPKAGTYLLSELLKKLGFASVGLHVSDNGESITDYRFISIEEGRKNYRNYIYNIPLDQVVKKIKPGQFVVGHFRYNEYIKKCLKEFKKIFIVRELRDCLVFHLRFLKDTNREDLSIYTWHKEVDKKKMTVSYLKEYGNIIFPMIFHVKEWKKDKDVFLVKFEELVDKISFRNVVSQLIRFLGLSENDIDPDKVLFQNTLTWSGKLTNIDEYWSSKAERYFFEKGLYELNKFFGY